VSGTGLPPVLGMADTGAEAPRVTPGSTPPVVALPPEPPDEALFPAVVLAAEVVPPALLAVPVPVAPVLPVVPVVPPVEVAPVVAVLLAAVPDAGEVTGAPVAVPALADGGAAVAVTTPQVGVVCPLATSAGVRSPQE
jgi:hypothetical protein